MSSPIVFEQGLPVCAFTPLELSIMERLFEYSLDERGDAFFYADDGEADDAEWELSELEILLDRSMGTPSGANAYVLSRLQRAHEECERLGVPPERRGSLCVPLDFSDPSWEFVVQDVIWRTPGLGYLQYTRGWSDGARTGRLGARACLVTAGAVTHKSSDDCAEELLAEARALGLVPPGG